MGAPCRLDFLARLLDSDLSDGSYCMLIIRRPNQLAVLRAGPLSLRIPDVGDVTLRPKDSRINWQSLKCRHLPCSGV